MSEGGGVEVALVCPCAFCGEPVDPRTGNGSLITGRSFEREEVSANGRPLIRWKPGKLVGLHDACNLPEHLAEPFRQAMLGERARDLEKEMEAEDARKVASVMNDVVEELRDALCVP